MKKTRRVNFKSILMWGCVFLLTLVLSMGGAYAYFTATATKKQSSATTGIIRVKFTDTAITASNGTSAQLKLVPGSQMLYAGKVVNDGTADMYAVIECGIYVSTSTDPISVQYFDATGAELTYDSTKKQYTSPATEIAIGGSSNFTIKYTVSTALGNEYKNTKATMKIVAHAIQTANLGTSTQTAKVHAVNILLGGWSAPNGYTQLDYIESKSGASYIDTGILPSSSINTSLEYDLVSGSGSGGAIMGSRCSINGQNNFYTFFVHFTNKTVAYNWGTYDSGYLSNTQKTTKSTLYNNGNKLYQDGKLIATATSTLSASTYPIYLFGMNVSGSAQTRSIDVKIYGCKIWDGGTLVRNFVPCKDSTGKTGMYDTVTSTFFSSKTSTNFTAGSAV